MIKGITFVHPIASSETFARLSTLLLSLGFESGKGWQDTAAQGQCSSPPSAASNSSPAVPSPSRHC